MRKKWIKELVTVLFLMLIILMVCWADEPNDVNDDFDNGYGVDLVIMNEPSIENPVEVKIYGDYPDFCEFEVTSQNVIECNCTFQEFVKMLYFGMTNVDSNDVIMKFADGIPEVVDWDKIVQIKEIEK